MIKRIRSLFKALFLPIRTKLMFRRMFKLSSEIFILDRQIQSSELPETVKKQSAALLTAYCALNKTAAYAQDRRSS